MSFLKWHKKQVEKNLNMFGLSNYQGLWVSFIKGLIFGAIIMWFVSCNEQVVVKKAPTTETETTGVNIGGEVINDFGSRSSEFQSDYSIGVKGNCGMCKSTIEKAVKGFKKLTKKIDLVHFNDSKDGFESSRDRHENLGKGNIPKAELEYVIKNCKTDIVVETPGGLEEQKKDIAWIKRRLKK